MRHTFCSVAAARRQIAFSLIEVLVVVALLSLIIIGLVAMFTQTQRAYRLGTTQVDVLESGRMVTDMLTRELQQITPTQVKTGVNFAVQLAPFPFVTQLLPGSPAPGRTNLIQELFFVVEGYQKWKGIGYRVSTPNAGIGTLYRYEYETNAFHSQNLFFLYPRYYSASLTNMSRILDNVVHFKIRAYDTNGNWIVTNNLTDAFIQEPWFAAYAAGEVESCWFSNRLVPASLEIELGILEERSAERARSITTVSARSNYIAQQAGKMHLFRWRVPVRNVDPIAYQ